MNNRFEDRKPVYSRIHISYFFLLFSVLAVAVFLYGINSIDRSTKSRQKESLHNTISQCVTHCYAVEGTYPPSLDYLKEHYGLIYDENTFFVDYTSIGSNLRPDITIIEKGE